MQIFELAGGAPSVKVTYSSTITGNEVKMIRKKHNGTEWFTRIIMATLFQVSWQTCLQQPWSFCLENMYESRLKCVTGFI